MGISGRGAKGVRKRQKRQIPHGRKIKDGLQSLLTFASFFRSSHVQLSGARRTLFFFQVGGWHDASTLETASTSLVAS